MIYTTLNKIRAHSPCADGWSKLLRHLGKTQADDEPLAFATILDSNGLDDALWCLRAVDGHQREMRLFAVWRARRVQHLITNPHSLAALDVAERHADGQVTDKELAVAWAAARDTEWYDAARDAARGAAWDAAKSATRSAARAAALNAAKSVMRSAAWDSACDTAWTAALDEAWDAQTVEFRRVFCGDNQ